MRSIPPLDRRHVEPYIELNSVQSNAVSQPPTASQRSTGDAARRILDAAAAELVAGNGALEMQAVARRAGVSVGLAYHHFGSKGGLLAAVAEAFYARLDEAAGNAAVGDIDGWAEREHRRVRLAVAFHYREPLAPLVLGRLSAEPEVAAVEKAHFERQVRRGARNIAQGQETGAIPARHDPSLLVAMVLGGVRAGVVTALARRPRPTAAALSREIWSFVEAATHVRVRPAAEEKRHAASSEALRIRDRPKAAVAGNRG